MFINVPSRQPDDQL